jgi:AbrB family looped-hinge helix DNA binding protein
MSLLVEEISTITAKGQTTVPKAVRHALGVDYGGKIAFRVNNGSVTVVRADEIDDPAFEPFPKSVSKGREVPTRHSSVSQQHEKGRSRSPALFRDKSQRVRI